MPHSDTHPEISLFNGKFPLSIRSTSLVADGWASVHSTSHSYAALFRQCTDAIMAYSLGGSWFKIKLRGFIEYCHVLSVLAEFSTSVNKLWWGGNVRLRVPLRLQSSAHAHSTPSFGSTLELDKNDYKVVEPHKHRRRSGGYFKWSAAASRTSAAPLPYSAFLYPHTSLLLPTSR